MMYQHSFAASTNPDSKEPTRRAVRTVPATATPSEAPTWRLVDAIAAATPAWERGIPETAALVIGAFSIPKPSPKTR